ncbi:MAG: SDR family NAD(P)-dependent oxidoreductase [Hyphomicrobiaceae bacterium]
MSKTILITGASSGIGRALAVHYSNPGARLVLVGRNAHRLAETAYCCRERGADAETAIADVRDRDRMREVIEANDSSAPFDIVIANAGVTTGTPAQGQFEPEGESIYTIEVNLIGVLNTVHPILPRMVSRRHGQIGIVSSIAGLIPVPDWPSYCASKAGILSYGRAMRDSLRPFDVGVSVICAGFVATAMSDRVSGWKPGIVAPERAAAIIARAIENNRGVKSFPWSLAVLARIGAMLPDPLRIHFQSAFRFTVASTTALPHHDSRSRSNP